MHLCDILDCRSASIIRSKRFDSGRYPSYTAVLQRALELWYHEPQVTTPVLKLLTELVQNRSQRLHFDVSSPNGILLFRETSSMITAYGEAANYRHTSQFISLYRTFLFPSNCNAIPVSPKIASCNTLGRKQFDEK